MFKWQLKFWSAHATFKFTYEFTDASQRIRRLGSLRVPNTKEHSFVVALFGGRKPFELKEPYS